MVDYAKAFDTIPREALWYRLSSLGISTKTLNIIRSIYASSRFSIRVEKNVLSEPVSSNAGVLQGCMLSPILFCLFINGALEELHSVQNSYVPAFGTVEIPCLAYADDVSLISHSPVGLQRLLNCLENWSQRWGMRVNIDKTEIITFKNTGCKDRKSEKWTYQGSKLEVVKHFSYLGVTFSYNGKWNEHYSKVVEKSKRATRGLAYFIYKNKNVDPKLPLRLFDTMCVPILLYGAEVLGIEEVPCQVESVARSFYKSVSGLPQSAANVGIELILGRANLAAIAKYRALSFWLRLKRMTDERIPKIIFESDVSRVDNPVSVFPCWARSAKHVLDHLGLGYLWGADKPNMKVCKYIRLQARQRLYDNCFQEQVASSRDLKSIQHFAINDIAYGMDKNVLSLKSFSMRRNYLRLQLNCPGDLVSREFGVKRCSKCKEIVRNIFVHLLFKCNSTTRRRIDCSMDPWYMNCLLERWDEEVIFDRMRKRKGANLINVLKVFT
jgi:hypothetical protein